MQSCRFIVHMVSRGLHYVMTDNYHSHMHVSSSSVHYLRKNYMQIFIRQYIIYNAGHT